MRYTEKDLFDYMDSGRVLRVTVCGGQTFAGRCWAYGAVVSEEEFGIAEPCLDVGCSTVLALSEIERIAFAGDAT